MTATAVAVDTSNKTVGKKLEIVRPDIRRLIATIVGVTPLLQNPPTEDYLRAIEKMGTGDAQSVSRTKDAEQEFLARLRTYKNEYLHPAEAFTGKKGVLTSAAKVARIKKVNSRMVLAAVKLQPDYTIELVNGLRPYVAIRGSEPIRDKHFATIMNRGQGVPVPIYRPRFDKWTIELRLSYWPSLISTSALVSLLVAAGEIGIGSWRPENGGTFGTFIILEVRSVSEFPEK